MFEVIAPNRTGKLTSISILTMFLKLSGLFINGFSVSLKTGGIKICGLYDPGILLYRDDPGNMPARRRAFGKIS